MQPAGGAVHQGPHFLHVGVPPTLGPAVRVRHVHAERRLPAAELTDRCHKGLTLASPDVAKTALGADALRAAIVAYRDSLRTSSPVLNRLNVYPVPDGDTGKNMLGTLEKVVTELEGAGPSMAEVCQAIAYGSLMGASGNSGIILCQVLRGFTDVGEGPRRTWTGRGRTPRSPAPRRRPTVLSPGPSKGTILTVVRASPPAPGVGDDLIAVIEAARTAAVEALAATPEQLPVLKTAGVVDAGGAGYCLFLDALLHVLDGRALAGWPADLRGCARQRRLGSDRDRRPNDGRR